MQFNDPRPTGGPPVPALALLAAVYPPHLSDLPTPPSTPVRPARPFVTLTYAQSLDGKIAGPGGTQLQLSGPESMRLTHHLRVLHDSILVGVGTVLNDDPQLTARLPSLLPLSQQPRPVILDSSLRTPPTCKLLVNAQRGISHGVTIVHRALSATSEEDEDLRRRAADLERAGARLIPLEPDEHGLLPLSALLSHPHASHLLGRSLMVEGGARIIASCLAAPPPGIVDLVIVTVAPVLVGEDGVSAVAPRKAGQGAPPRLEHVRTELFGQDSVVVVRPVYEGVEGEGGAA
ncbi:uncharacterized protein RHOBADRAFT_41233 [Rhodotorula graminis WP1]|uniref:2,5-diamino-6-ribosylamino-4(3H)-pyrimidinone 5'-phosphate reductase n=1 Tax=Rhodotorula graminis (strain WP1) TaxID=578459 RepID=A0A194SDX8_RHOGW|nr:uncharacterized protein RHOBADRAFT_41233 [Rhodotorula graminis WP1]KPV78690.1 hypothetical protein RHOBADRAFT_41233 [Rhodotorula graminis WP1]